MQGRPEDRPCPEGLLVALEGRAEDVANAALFLASDEARHITGEIVDVNGGLWMD